MARLMRKNATVTSSQVVDLTVADDLTVTDSLTAATIDASTDFTIGGLVVTDGNIADTGTLAIVPVDGCTIALGSDAGDDFNVDSGKFLVEGDTGKIGVNCADPGAQVDIRGVAGTGSASAGVLRLSTAETTVIDADQLGRIEFIAPLEATGTDAIVVSASIVAEADDAFAAANNETELVFSVGSSDAEYGSATSGAVFERMRIKSDGNIDTSTTCKITERGSCFHNSTNRALVFGY